MYVPIILGSDKTTVSVGTGHVQYHPLYISIGNLHNSARRAHRNALIPLGFLAIPTSDRREDNDAAFCAFKRQLMHSTLSTILQPLRAAMTSPVIHRCPDGHFRHVIFDLGPFITDYPEQCDLAGIVQGWCFKCDATPDDLDGAADSRTRDITDFLATEYGIEDLRLNWGIDGHTVPFTNDFSRADIHTLLSPDLLHQLIKGCFKDHLVDWVGKYLVEVHGKQLGELYLDDIDHRLAAVPAFPGLCRFPHGRHFKQWTGDDSKGLMKIYIPAIVDYVPPDMVRCIVALLDFYYLVR
ncbi:hypothetical protein OF83DRAFT_1177162 [Amylostereum chailletii]|nr:hypothetical protein OF83DRAFT_1177162 [Amylostereum chailletii]